VSRQQSLSPFLIHTNVAARPASPISVPEFRSRRAARTMLHSAEKSSKNAPTSHLVSMTFALFSKSLQLIENTSLRPITKWFDFNQLRTLFHSSPASPLFPARSPKHTGGIPPVAQSSRIAGAVAPSTPSGSDLFVLGERRFRFFAVHIAHRTICNFRGLQCLMP
jgi:hypothetical protein